MKYQFIKDNCYDFNLRRMTKVLTVSTSGYYQFRKGIPSSHEKEDERLLTMIKKIYDESRQTYGSPRVHAELQAQGEQCSRKRVARLMRAAGLMAKMEKRFKVTTKVNKKAKAAPNLLQQDFSAALPNKKWVSDITFVSTQEGWLYVAAILDLFSRRVIGLSMSDRITTDLILAALEQAITHRQPTEKCVHHSDRGCQYTSDDFQKTLVLENMIASMSGTGNCYDNAAMESFFHTLKTEHIYFENYETREEAKQSIFEYVEVFYNRKRRHSTLGYLSPEAFENQWKEQQNFSLPSVH
jgi:putative transposase